MPSSAQPTLFVRYVLFVAQFLGAGFVAGSVVHFGEGITVWDVSVLLLGIVLFTTALVYRETRLADRSWSRKDVAFLIGSSLFLSLTIGMASGGTQHFIDTPAYAAVLIPLGLSLGFVAFAITQRERFSVRQWCMLLGILALIAAVLHAGLLGLNRVLPETLRHGHGSQSHGAAPVADPVTAGQSSSGTHSEPSNPDHGH